MSVPPFDLDRLLGEDRWIRRLARELVTDPSTAEDLAQDAWVAALSARRAGASVRAVEPWFAGIVKNLWRELVRSSRRREDRERAAARPEATPATSELVFELVLRKRVAECLLELEEPYRTALALRFFKDASLQTIAKHQAVSVATAHARIERGLQMMRARLDDEHDGGRRTWALGLVPLAQSSSLAAKLTGGIVMGTGIKIAASALVAGGVIAWVWSARDEKVELAAAPAPPLAQSTPELEETNVQVPASPPGSAREARVPAPSQVAAAQVESDAASQDAIRGRVVDARGFPVGNVRVGWEGASSTDGSVVTGSGGEFELDRRAAGPRGERWSHDSIRADQIVCHDPSYLTLVPITFGTFGPPSEYALSREGLVVVAQRAAFGGVVVDPEGAPVAGAELHFRVRRSLFRQLGIPELGRMEPESWKTTSDERGRFALDDLAGGEGVALHAAARGYLTRLVDLPELGDPNLVVVLDALQQGTRITGRVLDPAGRGVEGAQVSAGSEIVMTASDGGFEFIWNGTNGRFAKDETGTWREEGPEKTQLIALKPGYLPAVERMLDLDLDSPIVLRLGAAPLSITGRVEDPEGKGLAGIVVWFRDPTRFGRKSFKSTEGSVSRDEQVEEQLCGGWGKTGAVSSSTGAFELSCLLPRSYQVLAFDPKTAMRAGPWTLEAGLREVVLTFPPEPEVSRVAGRIVNCSGEPLAGADVTPRRGSIFTERFEEPPFLEGLQSTITVGEDGRFEFERLATAGTRLQIDHPSVFTREVTLADFEDLQALEIVEPVLCELQVDLTRDPALADHLRVLDADGRELETMETLATADAISVSMGTQAAFVQGRSNVLWIKETARTLVLTKNGVEVLRLPVRLDPDERTTVTP